MDDTVSAVVGPCIACQATVNTPSQKPVKSTQLPNGPWESLAVDYYGLLPSGDYVLVIIDKYSRFPEIEFTTSTSAKATIPKLDRIFSSYGIPIQLKSDNRPPFNSKTFSDYCEFMGIQHNSITPLHPQANRLVENFNRMINKVMRTSSIERKCWKQEFFKFLRNYRATPHTTTGKSPAELLFQTRPYRVRLPELSTSHDTDNEVRERDAEKKLQAKQYADRKSYVKLSNLKVGDLVLMRNERKGKLQPVYDPKPYTVTARKGTMITASRVIPRHVITRNSSFFKLLKVPGNECGRGGIKMNGTCDECNVFESNIIHPEQLGGEEEIHENEQDDNLIGEAEEAVDNLVGDHEAEEAEQRQDDMVRRHDVDVDIQQEEYEDGNGQVQRGRRPRQRRAPRWHEEYEMGDY
ncbi:Transposon Ty3-I Gag-Pol poly [Paramuricea clavata]|uniref:Transposon Ty3-I Gag-Pol poly n=1 Tax=Paramuricea clavata TaxID=317549 RepID=A0A6S7J0D6_PARCT|nr:Transposon Ty3-I Gag-Pol poly [Paramuricea clavata]